MSDQVAAPNASDLIGVLAEPTRLAVFAAIVLGAATEVEVAATTGLPGREIEAALRRLRGCGLVERFEAHPELFKEAVRAAAAVEPEEFAGHPAADVLRAFLRRGRLLDLPADRDRRRVVLRYIAESSFDVGARYAEAEVNARLQRWGSDPATLRRYLVDLGEMGRADGRYWLR